MTDRILSHSSFSHIVDVPIERVDISDWLFNLPEANTNAAARPITSRPAQRLRITADAFEHLLL
jgi:hypothetical protein